MTYRKDIQILRGIAVLLVVFYHFGIFGFDSGFLGVDVFFVISGFLMAILYDKNHKLSFFKKRALRLLPAYFATILVTVLAAIIITTPNEFHQVFNQSIYANFFLSNIGYWAQNSYFSKAEFNVFLHLWSLGVEIQFYLIIPILFYFFQLHKALFWLLLIGSIALCFMMIGISAKTSFFMMPLRLWEFLIGFGIAYYLIPNGKPKVGSSWGGVGLFVIIAIPLFDINGQSSSIFNGHPAIYALLISLATSFVLLFGIGNIQYSVFGNVLEKIGQYSYSIYLVHFPVVVLFLYTPFSGTQLQIEHLSDLIWILVITAVLSYFLYHLVEIKLRKIYHIKAVLWLAPVLVFGLVLIGNSVQKQFFSDKQFKIAEAFSDRSAYRCGKIFRLFNFADKICLIGNNKDTQNNILLVGNSHADSIKQAFVDSANKNKITTYFVVENTPLMGDSKSKKLDAFSLLKGGVMDAYDVIDEALSHQVNHIVLHYSHNSISVNTIKLLVKLANKKDIFVSFIMPIPTYKAHIPKALWDYEQYNKALPIQTKADYQRKMSGFLKSLTQIKTANFKIYEVAHYFCDEKCRITADDDKPFYFDKTHLTLTGASVLSALFDQIVLEHKQ